MKNANKNHKDLVVDILTESFRTNKSIQYILKDTSPERVRALMEYSFDSCINSGKVLLSDDLKGCALISFPDKKKTTVGSLLSEAKLIINGVGIANIPKVLKREKKISSHYPKTDIYYLWFIGVHPDHQGRGVGGKLLAEIIEDSKKMNRPVYLETSTIENLPFYKKYGLSVYSELELTYTLYLINSLH